MRQRIELALGMHEYELNRGTIARERIFDLIKEPRARVVGLVEGGFAPGEYCFVILHPVGTSGSVVFWGLGLSAEGIVQSTRWRWAQLSEVPKLSITKRDAGRALRRRALAFPASVHGLRTQDALRVRELRTAEALYGSV